MNMLIDRAEKLILDAVSEKQPQSPLFIKTIAEGARLTILVIHISTKRTSNTPTVATWKYKAISEGKLICNVISSSTAPLIHTGQFNERDFELIEKMLQKLA